jgi:hypothetical protein
VGKVARYIQYTVGHQRFFFLHETEINNAAIL